MEDKSLPLTSVTLERFRKQFSLQPANFVGSTSLSLFPIQKCTKPWSKYSWQTASQASYEDLKTALLNGEDAIANVYGYNASPKWETDLEFQFPNYLGMHHTNGINVMGHQMGIDAGKGKLIAAGVRAADLIEASAALTYEHRYTDDSANPAQPEDWATITVTKPVDPLLLPSNQQLVRIFYPGMGGDARWEIPFYLVSEDATEWVFGTERWNLVLLNIFERYPLRDGFTPFMYDAGGNFLTEVDVYHVYNDGTLPTGTAVWENVSDCGNGTPCAELTQELCVHIRNAKDGIFYVEPVQFIADDPEVDPDVGAYFPTTWAQKRAPDKVRINLYSGKVAPEFIAGFTRDPVDNQVSQAICYLACARIDSDICECGNTIFDELKQDMAFSSKQGNFLAIAEPIQVAPFGAKKGEWYAHLFMKDVPKRLSVAVI